MLGSDGQEEEQRALLPIHGELAAVLEDLRWRVIRPREVQKWGRVKCFYVDLLTCGRVIVYGGSWEGNSGPHGQWEHISGGPDDGKICIRLHYAGELSSFLHVTVAGPSRFLDDEWEVFEGKEPCALLRLCPPREATDCA